MTKNAEGMMWVKLVTSKLPATTDILSTGPSSTLIPIRWTVKQTKSGKDLTSGYPSEKSAQSDLDGEGPVPSNADTFPTHSAQVPPSARPPPLSAPLTSVVRESNATQNDEDDVDDEDDVCVVCMARPPDFQLLPCRHDRFCRQCMVETVCTWVRPEAPSCPLCRAPFHTMVLLD
jgi:hypothetical protein